MSFIGNMIFVPLFWALDNTIFRRYGNTGSLSDAYRRALARRS